MIYRKALRPLLFSQDPETAHERTLEMLSSVSGLPLYAARRPFTHTKLATEVVGVAFPNPVGLAAGCDKNGAAVPAWPVLGFGFVEIGTVTAQPQPGNPRPRMFRAPAYGAVVNRLGFNSEGSESVARRLATLRRRARPLTIPLAVNIGKTKLVTGDDEVLEDYRVSFRRLSRFADLVVVNVSSPNTPGLRQWQEHSKLQALLGALMEEARILAIKREAAPVPIFVKISPDMEDRDMEDLVGVVTENGLAGIIATNTTISRDPALSGVEPTGGLSGGPLKLRALEVMRFLYRATEGKLPLIGVGGISSADDAWERMRAGASLVQFYTGMIYEGPYLARSINHGLLRRMEREGVRHISEIVGTGA